jgi:arginine decarboxylase
VIDGDSIMRGRRPAGPSAGSRGLGDVDIPVVAAVGRGPTELAAFDAALVAAGIADRNLIYLSSVLPPGSNPRRAPRLAGTPGGWGDRLYCVMAQQRTSTPGAEVWAGVGWVRDSTGRGLLVEHEADDEATLRRDVAASLEALRRNRGGVHLPETDLVVGGAVCDGTPVCALVVAVFEAASWRSLGPPAARTEPALAVPVGRPG